MSNPQGWLLIVGGILANTTASILIKIAGRNPSPAATGALVGLLRNPALLIGVASYGLTLLCYIGALRKLELSVVHPLMTSGPIVLVAMFSLLVLHESSPASKLIGLAFILLGILLVATQR